MGCVWINDNNATRKFFDGHLTMLHQRCITVLMTIVARGLILIWTLLGEAV